MPSKRHAPATRRKTEGIWKGLKGRDDWLPTGDDWLGERLSGLVRSMTERQKKIMYARYVLDLDQYVTAKIVGVSQPAVSQAESKVKSKAKGILSSRSTNPR